MTTDKRPRVVLVGRCLPDNENLGVAYLRSALSGAGISNLFLPLNRWVEMDSVCRRIMASGAAVVGLSLADGGSAAPALALGDLLRRRGFSGHITAGGQFATLARRWLLGRYRWLDSVVRHAGEVPLVSLVRSLTRGGEVQEVAGVTTRAGDGAPAPVLDTTPMQLWPEHDDLPRVLGRPMAFLSTSRGCKGRCGFCGPAALQDLEIEDGMRHGTSRRELVACGVGGVRRRSVENICNEMAHLWHERGVRYFYIVDEHPLPWKENEALDFLDRWKQGLARRKVGMLGLGAMLRSDRITEALARALVDLGLVRAFVGIELVTDDEARRYGRASMALHARRIIALLEQLGTATITNVMLVHPYSTPDTIRSCIEYLEDLPAGGFEVTQMQVYHGTRLHSAMQAEGRLQGNPLRYSYEYPDPTVERFAQAFSRLRAEVFNDYSLSYRTFDLRYSIALERHLGDDADRSGYWRKAHELASRINASRLSSLRESLDRSIAGSSMDDVIVRARRDARVLENELVRLTTQVESGGPGPRMVMAPMRAAAATALRLCLAGAVPAGCTTSQARISSDASVEEVIADPGDDGACTYDELRAMGDEIMRIAGEIDPCFVGFAHMDPDGDTWMVTLGNDYDGHYLCSNWEEQYAREQRLVEALAEVDLTCIPDHGMYVPLHGTEGDDVARLKEAIWESDCVAYLDLAIVVADDGRVVEARPWEHGPPVDPEVLECIVRTLEGLTFPCLAGYEICPEHVVLE